MKRLQLCFLTLTLLVAASSLAQTADDIISKHLAAIGGKEKLKGINSVQMETTMEVMGNEAPNKTVVINGKGFRSESDFNGQKVVQVVSDKGAWAINPIGASADAQALPEEQAKAMQAQLFIIPLLDYSSRGIKAEYAGQEKVGTINAYKVKLTDKDSNATTYYFDPATYYLIQEITSSQMMGQQVQMTRTFSDFKKTDYGWVVPQTMNIDMGQFAMSGKLKSIEVNKTIDPKVFDMPGK